MSPCEEVPLIGSPRHTFTYMCINEDIWSLEKDIMSECGPREGEGGGKGGRKGGKGKGRKENRE